MSDWVTFEEAAKLYGADEVTIRKLVMRGAVHTKREERTQLFLAADLVTCLSTAVEHVVESAGEWAVYSDLYRVHGVKRGWLDTVVQRQAVRYETRDGVAYYSVEDLMGALRENPVQDPRVERQKPWPTSRRG